MSTTHTPGPWEANSRSVLPEYELAVCELPKRSRAILGTHGLRRQEAIDVANLRLIAAAPDLLASLQALIALQDKVDPEGLFCGLEIINARAAIAKATKENP